MNASTPYRVHEFVVPAGAPFDDQPTRWPTVLAEFVRPALMQSRGAGYWFTYYGPYFQLCLAGSEYAKVEHALEQRRQLFGITVQKAPNPGATVGTALLGGRWMAPERNADVHMSAERSVLLVKCLHAACRLYLDQLIQDHSLKGRWRVENNQDANNPLGKSFESVFHLMSNMSRTQMQVNLMAAIKPNAPVVFAKVPVEL